MKFLCKLVLDVCFSFYTMKLEITFCRLMNLCLKEKKNARGLAWHFYVVFILTGDVLHQLCHPSSSPGEFPKRESKISTQF